MTATPSPTPGSDNGARIVVVDDEPSICRLMEDFFHSAGYQVETFTDPELALQKLPELEIDLLISDLKLSPSVDGTEVLRQLHETHPDAIGILMTAHPSLEVAVQVLKEGAYDFIQKPVHLADLHSTVQRGLEKRHLTRQVAQFTSAINMIRQGQAAPEFYFPAMLKRLVESAEKELETRGGAILLYNPGRARHRVTLGAVAGMEKIVAPWPPELRSAYEEICEQLARRLPAEGALPAVSAPALPGVPAPEIVAHPISIQGRLLGLLCLGFEAGKAGRRRKGAALSLFLDIVARTIESGRIHEELRHDYISVIRALSYAVEAKDPYTRGHSDRVVHYCESVGEMLGFDRLALERLGVAGILHDIGKIGVPDAILRKPELLSESEWEEIKKHPAIGDKILSPIASLSEVRRWIFQHHERMDGGGYPSGLPGEAIAPEAHLLIICEVFDALITERAYKPAWPIERAAQYLARRAGQHFDRTTVEAFIAVLEREGEDFLRFDPERLITYTSEVGG